jgi:hypothetical protein
VLGGTLGRPQVTGSKARAKRAKAAAGLADRFPALPTMRNPFAELAMPQLPQLRNFTFSLSRSAGAEPAAGGGAPMEAIEAPPMPVILPSGVYRGLRRRPVYS